MGFFSWKTQDTNRSIANLYSNRKTFRVHMVNPVNGTVYTEDNYEGYGVFGGKDYFELLAEINGLGSDRTAGIYQREKCTIFPILVEDVNKYQEFLGQEAEFCPDQGFFYAPEETTGDCYEICPCCEHEVFLQQAVEKQPIKCPKCGKFIMPCSLCSDFNQCATCPWHNLDRDTGVIKE